MHIVFNNQQNSIAGLDVVAVITSASIGSSMAVMAEAGSSGAARGGEAGCVANRRGRSDVGLRQI